MTFKQLRRLWMVDLYRYTGETSIKTLIKHVCFSDGNEHFSDGVKFSFHMRLCSYLSKATPKLLTLPFYFLCLSIFNHYKYKFGVWVAHSTLIGEGFYIGHVGGIVVSDRAVIGKNCNISQGVTIGASNRGRRKGTPIIGDNVYIGPGAKIFGAITVGNNVAVGANCVVTTDVPDHAVIVGIPGKVISLEGSTGYVNRKDYEDRTEEIA